MPRIEVHQKVITRLEHPSNSNIHMHIGAVRAKFIEIARKTHHFSGVDISAEY